MQKIKQLINGTNSIRSASVILIITLLVSNFLGLIRDHFLAQKIPTNLLDTYYAAFRIPDFIFNILILGAIAAAFIPVFTSYISNKNLREAWRVANSFLNIAIIAILVFAIILFFLMPYLVPMMVPKFDLEKQQLTISLSRLLLISPIFFTLSYIFGGILNSFKRFFIYSLAPLLYNLSIIVATLIWADTLSVYGVVYGVIIGAFFHMLIQAIYIRKIGFRYQLLFDFRHPGVKKIYQLMIPRSIGLGANQVMLLVYTGIASTLAAGSVAIFNLADNIQTMPTVVFATSFATAIFPTLSEHISLGKKQEFSNHIWKVIKSILYILIPLSVIIILLRAQIVRLILGSGHFGWEQTVLTADTLALFAISLVAQGMIPILARSFYAMHNTKIPTIVSIISMAISILLAFILTPKMGVLGLALSFSVASFFNAITLYVILRKEESLIRKQEPAIWRLIGKIIIATVVMAIILQVAKYSSYLVDMERFWGVLTQAAIATILAILTYIFITRKLNCDESRELIKLFRIRFKYHNNGKQIQ